MVSRLNSAITVATEVMAQPHCSMVVPHQSGPNSGSFAFAYSSLAHAGLVCLNNGAAAPLLPAGTTCFAAFTASFLSHMWTPA